MPLTMGCMSTPYRKFRTPLTEDTNLGEVSGKVLLVRQTSPLSVDLPSSTKPLEKLYRLPRSRPGRRSVFPPTISGPRNPAPTTKSRNFRGPQLSAVGLFLSLKRSTVVGEAKHPLYKELIAAQPKPPHLSEHFRENLKRTESKPTRSRSFSELREVLWLTAAAR